MPQNPTAIEKSARTDIARAMPQPKGSRGARTLATALGWFSIGLGVTEIVAPRALAKLAGIRPNPGTTRLMGLREIAAGAGILSMREPAPWLWARVGGDMVDLAALWKAGQARRAKPGRVTAAASAVAGVAVLDALCAHRLGAGARAITLSAAAVVNRPREECYRYWRDIEKLPRFITHIRSVRVTGDRRSHWIGKGPAGQSFSWDAEIIADAPGERIAWRSLEGADVPNSGSVEFQSVRRGQAAIVRVHMEYEPPASAGGALLGKLLGRNSAMQVRKDLLRFKQLLETGEIATTEGQPAGRPSGATWLDLLARV